MKNPKKRKILNNDTILCDPAYWRMRADILALVDLIGLVALAESYPAGGKQPTRDQAQYFRADIEKRFKKLSASRYGELLIELENHSPELAAALDSRGLDEVRID